MAPAKRTKAPSPLEPTMVRFEEDTKYASVQTRYKDDPEEEDDAELAHLSPTSVGTIGDNQSSTNMGGLFCKVWFGMVVMLGGAVLFLLAGQKHSMATRVIDNSTNYGQRARPALDAPLEAPAVDPIHYEPVSHNHHWSPYDNAPDFYSHSLPSHTPRGYLSQPSLYNDTLAFVSEGDLYLSQRGHGVALKLTTTAGNVNLPKLRPPTIAYTATYDARRDVYLMDYSTGTNERLTYFESGVYNVVDLHEDRVVFAAGPDRVGLPSSRLYTVDPQGIVQPIPLAQAVDAAFGDDDECLYFVRYRQSSQTVRYVGGTAEQLWAYCDGQAVALPLTTDYRGTSKSPQIWKDKSGNSVLLFLSDRDGTTGEPATMNLFAMPLPAKDDLYSGAGPKLSKPVQITAVSCDMNGLALREYSVDPVTGNAVLRIGADFFLLTKFQLQRVYGGEGPSAKLQPWPIAVYSDFHEHQERMVPVTSKDWTSADAFETAYGPTQTLISVRGQAMVLPVIKKVVTDAPFYQGAGQNMPQRRYRVAPGTATAGSMRVLKALHIPQPLDDVKRRQWVLLLATDPLSPTAEHAMYKIEAQADIPNAFADLDHMPIPFLGGHVAGGSTREGGLGSVLAGSLTASPCGRRIAWTDTDGRICVMTVPAQGASNSSYIVLPEKNEQGEPMNGVDAVLSWSPGGRYLAVSHAAANQFDVITVVDCGNPFNPKRAEFILDISLGQMVQVTPSRFNSNSPVWGWTTLDQEIFEIETELADILDKAPPKPKATTLFYLTDRDVVTDVSSPWGTRAPSPHFKKGMVVYALPFNANGSDEEPLLVTSLGAFSGGGVSEAFIDDIVNLDKAVEDASDSKKKDGARRKLKEASPAARATLSRRLLNGGARRLDDEGEDSSSLFSLYRSHDPAKLYPEDLDIDFGTDVFDFSRRAYRMARIPKADYVAILSQTTDDASLVLAKRSADPDATGYVVELFSSSPFPSDDLDVTTLAFDTVVDFGLSTSREHLILIFATSTKVVANAAAALAGALMDELLEEDIVADDSLSVSVIPRLEYQQLYSDAWRLLRDYFYDPNMHQVDWTAVFTRYQPLVERCHKREELDDVLEQMAAELSALHVFVYGGEYNAPLNGDPSLVKLYQPASLGATLVRSPEWKGYMVTEVPERDPDFNQMDGNAFFCPVSDQTLAPTGQKGLHPGDVIVAVNGESTMLVPDLNMLLRGTMGRSVRLDVIRLSSRGENSTAKITPEPLVVVPYSPYAASDVRYDAWEWRTRQKAKQLAAEAGFSVGYIHMQAMGEYDVDAFARDFFPDFNKDALILDVRHNRGGNIDSWILTFLQKRAWMYWGDRTERATSIEWDMQYSFRGHIVVLIDENTASDGEAVTRGILELGLGRVIGTRTWGGGIWLSSDNTLVDGGIATAPEAGVFNGHYGWGMNVEQHGVDPDIEVDNNPRTAFDGVDTQLERAIAELKQWLQEEPIVPISLPKQYPDMSLKGETCPSG